MAGGFRVREQKFICGKDYATAETMQVDFFEITEQQHKASNRKKKELASSIAKEAYNFRQSGRYLELLIQRNFRRTDYSVTYTYDNDHLPAPGDMERVDKDFSAAMKKLYRMCDKAGIAHPGWAEVAEYTTYVDGKWVGRHHHHIVMQHTEGLTREMVEKAWGGRGMARCEPLNFDHGYIHGSCKVHREECSVQTALATEPRAETAQNAPPERRKNEPRQTQGCLRESFGRSCVLGENVPRLYPALLRTNHHGQQHPPSDRAPLPQRNRDEEQEESTLSVRLELSDLPPRIRAQAEAQIAARGQKRAPATPSMAAAASIAETAGMDFDSRGEYDYYMGVILPKVQRGQIVNVETHRAFSLLPEKEYGNVKLPAARYTADFVLTYADGTTEVVEVKSKFTRRQQRDYIYRRRLFIDLVAEPRGWRFVEHITPDTSAEIKAWKRLAKQKG